MYCVMQTLLIFGGNNSNVWLKNVDELKPSESSWTNRSLMPEARGYGAAAAIEGTVYLMGGGNGKKWYNTCLRFDVDDDTWYAVRSPPPLPNTTHILRCVHDALQDGHTFIYWARQVMVMGSEEL